MNQLVKTWDIPGGVHPPENKAQSLKEPLGRVELPSQLILPLSQHIGTAAKPIVAVGDTVLGGQVLAEADGIFSAHVHAPTSGRVAAITEHVVPHPSGMTDECIILETDGKDEWIELIETPDYASLDKQTMLEKIRFAGIAGLGGAGFPTSVKLNPRADQRIDTLIINGTECEPYITADDMLMRTRPVDIVKGTELLAKLLNNPERVVIGIEDNKPEAIEAMQKAAEGTEVEIVSFPTKYPSGGEKQLIQILTGREVPSGQIPATIGVVCQNVGTTAAVYRAVRYSEPLVSRITTVVGEALDTQRNVEVLLGTPVRHVMEQHGFSEKKASRLVMGGPMMGFALPDTSVPVVKITNCLLAPSKKELPPPVPAQACIRCGLCAEACPASLLPQQLFWYAQSEDFEKLENHNLFDCIECGACSYVCPSHIPLVQYYRAAKGEIRQQRIDKEKSDRSRRRFEFRQERIAKAEAEKEAKRLARKKAAEEAKKKMAEEKDKPAKDDAVGQGAAKAEAQAPDPAKQRAKLERLLASAEESLKQAKKPLGDDATDEQLEKQKARIKQAELKVSDAQKKLDALGDPADKPSNQPDKADKADDPVTAAIERARAKAQMAPEEKLRNSLESLYKRLEKAKDKARQAEEEGSDKAEALAQGVAKLQSKIADTQKELDEHKGTTVAEATPHDEATASAADNAIERAKAKAAAMSTMSADDKLRNQAESLKARLEKARARLEKAQAEDSEHIDAFQSGVDKLEKKLADTQAQLNEHEH